MPNTDTAIPQPKTRVRLRSPSLADTVWNQIAASMDYPIYVSMLFVRIPTSFGRSKRGHVLPRGCTQKCCFDERSRSASSDRATTHQTDVADLIREIRSYQSVCSRKVVRYAFIYSSQLEAPAVPTIPAARKLRRFYAPYPDPSDPAQQIFQQLGSPSDSTSQFSQMSGGINEVLRRISLLRSSMSGGSGNPSGARSAPDPNFSPGYPAGPSGSPSSSNPMDATALLRLYAESTGHTPITNFQQSIYVSASALGGMLNNAMVSAALTPGLVAGGPAKVSAARSKVCSASSRI